MLQLLIYLLDIKCSLFILTMIVEQYMM